MRKNILTAFALFLLFAAKAQFTYDYLKAADNYFRKGDYYSAAQYYEKFLNTNGKKSGGFDPYVLSASSKKTKAEPGSKDVALYNLAESYRRLNYYVKAEPYYELLVAAGHAKFPLALYHYGTTLRALKKFEEAEKAFQQFLSEYRQADQYMEAAKREMLNLQFIQAEMRKNDLDQYDIGGSEAFASTGADYAPVWVSPSLLYFTSTRPETGAPEKEFLNKVYETVYNGKTFGDPVKLNLPQPAGMHQGGVTVSADGNTLFLTRWSANENGQPAGIYRSSKTAGGWSEPVSVTGLSANGTANDKQPFLMPDGRLLFASDRAGGQGGFDLWMASFSSSGEVAAVTNLGPQINTPFNEEAPFYHAASETLVFSTNGRVGMGGFDLFYTNQKNGTWSEPKNFGYPVNSIKNDMYFTSRGNARNILEEVLLSSDRNAPCCLQMVTLRKPQLLKLLAGIVVDCKTNEALEGAVVEVKAPGNETVFSGTTSAGGTYNFSLKAFQPLQISAALQGYTAGAVKAGQPANEAAQAQTIPVLCLNKIPVVGTVEVLNNVYFAFNKATVLEESFESLNALAQMLKNNPTIWVEISGHTDSKGDDVMNQRLSEERARSVVDYLVKLGIERIRLVAVGYGESQPIAPNTNPDGSDNPEGREKNRRTEFKVLKN